MLSIKRKLTLSTTSGSLLPFVCFTAFYLEKVFTQNYVCGSPQYFKHSWTITKYFLSFIVHYKRATLASRIDLLETLH